VLGSVLGLMVGGCSGFIGQFILYQTGTQVSDAYALGMMCGGGVLCAGIGALAAFGLIALLNRPKAPRGVSPDNPWADQEDRA
jgi:hypothetical protein